MTYSAIIRLGPLVSAEALLDPSSVRAGRSLYQRGSMTLLRGAAVLVDHDEDLIVGAVEKLWEWTEGTGGWLVARCRIDEPPAWLKQGSTKASFRYANLGPPQRVGDWERVSRGLVTEVSLLSSARLPADGAAKVLLLERQAAGEHRLRPGETWIPDSGGPIRRSYKTEITIR